jgi:ABC-type Fe3+/spermidine/putrescine transport system ATPase subunit
MDKLEVSHLTKAFGKAGVLNDVSFTVRAGEFLSVLGPSGCGKTTLLRILMGLETPDGGTVRKDGAAITNVPPAARGMGIVFQNCALFENMTALGNVEYALLKSSSLRGRYSRAEARAAALEMLELVGLAAHAGKKPRQLSGGQQQRVAVARTLALRPDVVLFDEPMSALDAETRLGLRAELKALQARFGTTMLYVTHDQEEAFALADRVMVLGPGGIRQLDTPRAILAQPADDYVRQFVLDNLQTKLRSLAQFAGEAAP